MPQKFKMYSFHFDISECIVSWVEVQVAHVHKSIWIISMKMIFCLRGVLNCRWMLLAQKASWLGFPLRLPVVPVEPLKIASLGNGSALNLSLRVCATVRKLVSHTLILLEAWLSRGTHERRAANKDLRYLNVDLFVVETSKLKIVWYCDSSDHSSFNQFQYLCPMIEQSSIFFGEPNFFRHRFSASNLSPLFSRVQPMLLRPGVEVWAALRTWFFKCHCGVDRLWTFHKT